MAWISTAKLAAISIAAALLALAAERLRLSTAVAEIAPRAWISVGAWLKPPYLYIVVNGIIISIAASSRLRYKTDEEAPPEEKLSCATSSVVVVVPPAEDHYYYRHGGEENIVVVKEVIDVKEVDEKRSTVVEEHDNDDGVLELSAEKPRRKLAKPEVVTATTPQGGLRALKASKPKRNETLESTWKMITEGRSTPLTRQMKRCDTWQNHRRQMLDRELGPPVVEKSETFKDRTNQKLPAVTPRLRIERSLSQDELNKRVEAFINKFNEEMRLQRQESLNRGAHS